MQNSLTIQEKLEIVSKDFLDRDGDSYTFARKDGRLDWEKTLGEGGSYSSYILNPKNNEDLIKNAYNIASDMIVAMNTPFKVKVNITGNQSCTDSKNVYVGTKVFDDNDLTVGQKLDTFIGHTIHEGCHLLYTDFKSGFPDKLTHSLQNIIEDERIERECGQNMPGLVNFLKAAKYYSFDKYVSEVAKKGGYDKLNTFQKLLNAILSYIRYPKALNPNDTREFVDVLIAVKETLTPYPASSEEVNTAAKKIAEVIKDFLKNHEKEKKTEGKGEKKNGDSSSEKKEEQPESSVYDDNEGQGETETQNSQEESEDIEEPAEDSEDSSDEISDAEIDQDIEDSMSELQKALNNIVTEPKDGLSKKDKSNTVLEDGGNTGDVCQGDLDKGINRHSYIKKEIENKFIYDSALNDVKRYIPAISRALKMQSTEYKLSLRGMRSGVLDTGKLAEAYQGVPTVYMRDGEVKTDKVSVCILIDESGSMYGNRESSARKTAILLNEALSKLHNVDLYIYGHTGWGDYTELYVYREKNFHPKYALGSTNSRSGNHDSIAISEACARVRKYTKDKCLFFMISDGAPNERPEKVRNAVEKVEKDNFTVVAISIDPYYNPSMMYKRNVTFSDLSTLASDMGKMVKKAIMDNTKKKINL